MEQKQVIEEGLWVLAAEHHTKSEGGTTKVHITNDAGKILCGANPAFASGTGERATFKWINQPDPDECMCKKCKSIAIKWYQTQNKPK